VHFVELRVDPALEVWQGLYTLAEWVDDEEEEEVVPEWRHRGRRTMRIQTRY
jgi:hypothetical protein